MLDLLNRKEGPVLEDLVLDASEDHLDARHQKVGQNCSAKGCNFDDALSSEEPAGPPEIALYDGDFSSVSAEIASLKRHHETYLEKYQGRTQVGYSGVSSDTIVKAAQNLNDYVNKRQLAIPLPEQDSAVAQNAFVRLCADDLKAYYLESRLAEKSGVGAENSTQYNDWLWYETKIGSLIVAARGRVIETTDTKRDPNWMIARAMVPRGYGESGYTMVAKSKVEG